MKTKTEKNRVRKPQEPSAAERPAEGAVSRTLFIQATQALDAVLAFDYPAVFFEPRLWSIPRARPDRNTIAEAAALLKTAKKPLIISGGGVRYSGAEIAPVGRIAAGIGGGQHQSAAGREDAESCEALGAPAQIGHAHPST